MIAPRLCGSRKYYQPGAGWEVGWTGMGELECLTSSQVEEGGGVGLRFLCWGPVGRQLLLKLWERRGLAARAVTQARMQVCKRWQKDEH